MSVQPKLWYRPLYYSEWNKAHQCECWDGTVRYVDLLSSQDLPADTDPHSMNGKLYRAASEVKFLSLADGVREIKQRIQRVREEGDAK